VKNQPEQVEKLLNFVTSLSEGSRNSGLFWAACRAVENGEPESVFTLLVDAGITVGLNADEVSRTIESARRQGGLK
jgi:NAD(P)H-dependent FMN reductase